jgi:carbon monoxide dehydrogenase subunit G
MKLEQSFSVEAPIDEVWTALIDVERVAPCLPGAEITDRMDDGSFAGTFTVSIGPTSAAYRGMLKLESLDPATHTATMTADGTDKRGQGGAHATIVSSLRDEGGTTHVDVVTDFTITGRLARFGRGGMIEDISNRLLRDFAECLQATIGSRPAATAQPVDTAPPHGDALAPHVEPPPVAEPPQPAPVAEPQPVGEPPEAAQATEPQPRTGSIPPPSRAPAAPPQQAKPVKGLSLFFSVLWERIRRALRRKRS